MDVPHGTDTCIALAAGMQSRIALAILTALTSDLDAKQFGIRQHLVPPSALQPESKTLGSEILRSAI